MLNLFKKLFSKSEETPAQQAAVATAPATAAPPAPAAPALPSPGPDAIKVSLKSIVAGLPDAYKSKLIKDITSSDIVALPRGEVMTQLASGAVKITFLDLTRRVPGVFGDPDAEMAPTMVNIPLPEILPQIKQLPRRQAQKVVEIPTDLEQVFGPGSAQKAPVPAPPSSEPPAAPRTAVSTAPTPAPARPPEPVAPPAVAPPAPKAQPPAPRPVPPPSPVAAPSPTPAPAPPSAAAPSDAFVPPPTPKPLPSQEAIKFSLPGQPAPAAPAAPTPPSAPAPAPIPISPRIPSVPPPPPAAPVSQEGPVIGFGEIFGHPEKKDWSAQEVAQKAAALRGVAGALITTADGLPVAFHLPDNLSGNVVAAFVPQMYTRIMQYTRDLKLGEARHLTVLIENTPLQIFKAGSVYFTILGKPGENLPKPQLTAIANALGRQNP